MSYNDIRKKYINDFKKLSPLKKAFASAVAGAGACAFGAVTTGLLGDLGMVIGLGGTIYTAVEIAMASHEGYKTDPNSLQVLKNMLAFTAGFAILGACYHAVMLGSSAGGYQSFSGNVLQQAAQPDVQSRIAVYRAV